MKRLILTKKYDKFEIIQYATYLKETINKALESTTDEILDDMKMDGIISVWREIESVDETYVVKFYTEELWKPK